MRRSWALFSATLVSCGAPHAKLREAHPPPVHHETGAQRPSESVADTCAPRRARALDLEHGGRLLRASRLWSHVREECRQFRDEATKRWANLVVELGDVGQAERLLTQLERAHRSEIESMRVLRELLAGDSERKPVSPEAETAAARILEQAREAFAQSNYGRAGELALQARSTAPANGEALLLAGLCEQAQGRAAEGERLLERGLVECEREQGSRVEADFSRSFVGAFNVAWSSNDGEMWLESSKLLVGLRSGTLEPFWRVPFEGDSVGPLYVVSEKDRVVTSRGIANLKGNWIVRFPVEERPSTSFDTVRLADKAGLVFVLAGVEERAPRIIVYDLDTATEQRVVSVTAKPDFYHLYVPPDGTWIGVGIGHQVRVQSYPSGRFLGHFWGDSGHALENRRLVLSSGESVRLVSLDTKTVLREWNMPQGLEEVVTGYSLESSAGGETIAGVSHYFGVMIRSAREQAPVILSRNSATDFISPISVSRSGRWLAMLTPKHGGELTILDADTGERVRGFPRRPTGGPATCKMSPDGSRCLARQGESHVLLDFRHPERSRRLPLENEGYPFSWIDNETMLLFHDGAPVRVDANTGTVKRMGLAKKTTDRPVLLRYAPAAHVIVHQVRAGPDRRLELLSSSTGRQVHRFPLDADWAQVSRSGRYLMARDGSSACAAGCPQRMHFYEIGVEEPLAISTEARRGTMLVMGEGRPVAASRVRDHWEVWDAAANALTRLPPSGESKDRPQTCVSFANEDRWLVLGHADGRATVWEWGSKTVREAGSEELPDAHSWYVDPSGRFYRCPTGRLAFALEPGLPGSLAYVMTREGGFDFIGGEPETKPSCVIGHRVFPWEVCQDLVRVPGLLGKALAGDTSYRQELVSTLETEPTKLHPATW